MNRILSFLFLIYCINSVAFGQTQPEVNVIYGDHHIFTINTPDGWTNDKEMAQSIGLVSFFYSKADKDSNQKSHMYAMGYDKDENNKDLTSFINGDIKNFKKKYPDLTYEEVKIGTTGGIIDGKMLSFDNLTDRYKEEVIYMETNESILVFIFSTFTEKDYNDYQTIFDSFIGSFNYRGNNPQPYLDWVKSKK